MADVKVEGVSQNLYGQGGIVEPLVGDGKMRPWKNGVPYGMQLHMEQQELTNQYKFLPGVAGRLRAATKRALGR